jgi:hypothetical protein
MQFKMQYKNHSETHTFQDPMPLCSAQRRPDLKNFHGRHDCITDGRYMGIKMPYIWLSLEYNKSRPKVNVKLYIHGETTEM